MVETVKKSLRASAAARWTALVIVSFTMLCGYYVADVASPLKPLMEQKLHWTSSQYGFFTGGYAWLNIIGGLLLGGILLDKLGARLAGILAGLLMVAGCGLKWYAIQTTGLFGGTFLGFNAQVFTAAFGFSLFGLGLEICGVTATKIIARWFKGYEIALAMGIQVGVARVGTAIALGLSDPIARAFKDSVGAPIFVGFALLVVGFVAYLAYCAMDRKLDASEADLDEEPEEPFRFSDIGQIIRIRSFWYLAILCALFYSAVFPFLKYAPDLMVQKFHVKESWAGAIPGILPFAAIPLTIIFGRYYDQKGKGATLMILGSVLLVVVHGVFSIPGLDSWGVALIATIVLGFGFALVPSAMWPSVPRFIPHRQLGTAYALIFWLQNLVALWGIPYLIGWVLDRYCIVGKRVVEGASSPAYNYTLPMLIFMACGVLAVVFGWLLKADDRRMGYGLELPSTRE
nr:MFS transporter [uncultured Holophaga sp.]